MVLWLKPWESRSLPGLQRTNIPHHDVIFNQNAALRKERGVFLLGAIRSTPAGAAGEQVVAGAVMNETRENHSATIQLQDFIL